MWPERVKEVAAIGMIGEGALGLMHPRNHLHLWHFGPAPYRGMVQAMENHPDAMRLLFAAELGVGLWWAQRLLSNREPIAGRCCLESRDNDELECETAPESVAV